MTNFRSWNLATSYSTHRPCSRMLLHRHCCPPPSFPFSCPLLGAACAAYCTKIYAYSEYIHTWRAHLFAPSCCYISTVMLQAPFTTPLHHIRPNVATCGHSTGSTPMLDAETSPYWWPGTPGGLPARALQPIIIYIPCMSGSGFSPSDTVLDSTQTCGNRRLYCLATSFNVFTISCISLAFRACRRCRRPGLSDCTLPHLIVYIHIYIYMPYLFIAR